MADERLGQWISSASNHARRNRKEETKKERSPVTHKDGRRVEIMRKESNRNSGSDDCDERPQVGLAQEPKIRQFECVQKKRSCTDCDDSCGQPIKAIDQIDRLSHT